MTTKAIEVQLYISTQFPKIPRYQIEQKLLQHGFSAKAIEANWHSVLHEHAKKLPSRSVMAKQRTYAGDYISDNFPTRSRYEIDRELLERGFDAGYIDTAWHSILHPKKKTLKSVVADHKKKSIVLVLLGLVILYFTVFYVDPNRVLFDSVPDYPNATPITVDSYAKTSLEAKYGILSYGKASFKVYLTADSADR